ncbi:MAG: replication factor C small subunit [Theionarchaea archaeon]|nr:replication factor C small subunit [Theionarchaea archaeon]
MNSELPWIEKYRPTKLAEVSGQVDVVRILSSFVEQKRMSHLIFAGPAGVGKTTCALILAREILGDDWRSNFLELNASDERGIDVVRTKIKNFCRSMVLGESPFRIVFLDEVDNTTSESQHALRREMEQYTATSRFIMSCNYSSRLISPIQSRCVVLRYAPLKREDLIGGLKKIVSAEDLDVEDSAFDALFYVSQGDMRRATNILQAAHSFGGKISQETVYRISGEANPGDIRRLLAISLNGDFGSARDQLRGIMFEQGLSGLDLVTQMHREAGQMEISRSRLAVVLELLAEYEFRLVEGSNDLIQCESLIAQLCSLE